MHLSNLPRPDIKPRKRWLPSLIWLVPLLSALIGVALVVKSVTDKGPVVTVTFNNAEGIEAGKTKVKYKDVEIGVVQAVALSADLRHVIEDGGNQIFVSVASVWEIAIKRAIGKLEFAASITEAVGR